LFKRDRNPPNGLAALLTDRLAGNPIIGDDFKADFNNYLAGRPTRAGSVPRGGDRLRKVAIRELSVSSQEIESRDSEEYLEHIVKRNILRGA
jgi:hypothetical protein